jgi:hypothetical protein
MRYQEPEVRECPKCGAEHLFHDPESGNTFGAVWWTDGWVDAPMLPTSTWITRCSACDAVSWRSHWQTAAERLGGDVGHRIQELLGLRRPREVSSPPDQVEPLPVEPPPVNRTRERLSPLVVSEQHFLRAIDSGLAQSRDDLVYLRTGAWRRANHPLRGDAGASTGSLIASDAYSPRAKDNLTQLAMLTSEWDFPDDRLAKAEMCRCLGRFDEAAELLTPEVPPPYRGLRTFLTARVRERDGLPRPLPSNQLGAST